MSQFTFGSMLSLSYCDAAIFAWVSFEHVLTIRREVDLFWRRKFTGATWLFLVNRYMLLFSFLFNFLSSLRSVQMSLGCSFFIYLSQTIQSAQYIPCLAFSGIRVYALARQGMKLFLALLVVALTCIPLSLNLIPFAMRLTALADPVLGCIPSSREMPALTRNLDIVGRASLMVADVIVIYVTIDATYQTTRLNRMGENRRHLFADVLYEYGLSYFIILAALNVVQLVLTALSGIDAAPYITTFIQPTITLIIQSFLLRLQEVNQHTSGQSPSATFTSTFASESVIDGDRTYSDSLCFREMVVGSLGSALVLYSDITSRSEGAEDGIEGVDWGCEALEEVRGGLGGEI